MTTHVDQIIAEFEETMLEVIATRESAPDDRYIMRRVDEHEKLARLDLSMRLTLLSIRAQLADKRARERQ
jgi:hypothetical protein